MKSDSQRRPRAARPAAGLGVGKADAALALAADRNFVAHAGWAPARLAGMRVVEDAELVVVDSGLPCDTFNLVCRARLEPRTAAARVAGAVGHFARVRRPFSWWVGPADLPRGLGDILEDAGLERAETELAMAAELAGLPAEPPPAGLEVRRVRTREELLDFARVNAANWSPPDPEVLRFYTLAAGALLSPESPQRFYVGYVDGAAVAAAELTVAGGVAGLYNISTLESYRRRGIGSALTLRPLLNAREGGQSTAVLQAAPGGVGVYTRLGFRAFGEITEYKPRL